MSVNVCLPLFGAPSHELEAEGAVRGKHLRTLGDDLRERLQRAADTLDRLEAAGWAATVAMYEIALTHPGVETQEQAEQHLLATGLDPVEFMIVEEIEDSDGE